MTSLKNRRRDLGKGANNCRRVRSLKGRDIRTVVDGERVAIVSDESEKSRVVPFCDITRQGVKYQSASYLLPGRGDRKKILGPDREAAEGVVGGGKGRTLRQ